MAGGGLDSLLTATNFAAVKHKGQKRKDPEGSPYINHPIGVAHILSQVQETKMQSEEHVDCCFHEI